MEQHRHLVDDPTNSLLQVDHRHKEALQTRFYLIWVVIIDTDAWKLWSNVVGLLKKFPTVSVRPLSELVGKGDLLYWRRAGQYADVCEQSRVQHVGCCRRCCSEAQQQANSYPQTEPL